MVYTHQAPESFNSKLVKLGLKITNRKTSLVRIVETQKSKAKPAKIPNTLKKICNITDINVKGHKVYILEPKQNKSEKVVFYSHGGGHVNNILIFHWQAITYMIKHSGAKFIVPDYPLLPDDTAKETYEMLEETIRQTIKGIKRENFILMGDSAGGSLSLGLAQLLRNNNFPVQPTQIILLSPELDFENFLDEVNDVAPYDVMLSPEVFEAIGSRYCGNLPRNHYLVSPLLGELNGLGKISIFIGTYDILYPYAIKLRENLKDLKIDYNYFEYPKMMHVWLALTFLKESKPALNQIVALIKS